MQGTCRLTAGGPKCVCAPGFAGEKCEKDKCKDFCKNGGMVGIIYSLIFSTNVFILVCIFFVFLQMLVLIIGTCLPGNKKLYCSCGPRYTGPLCEVDLCNCSCESVSRGEHCPCVFPPPEECQSNVVQSCRPGMCKNGGVCIESRGNPVCR